MFKNARKNLKIPNAELISFLETKTGAIYQIEKNYAKKPIIKYIIYLRKKGLNLNKFFDAIIENEFPKIKKNSSEKQ